MNLFQLSRLNINYKGMNQEKVCKNWSQNQQKTGICLLIFRLTNFNMKYLNLTELAISLL